MNESKPTFEQFPNRPVALKGTFIKEIYRLLKRHVFASV